MQITLVSSGDTVCDVLDKFVSLFCVNESELNSITDSQYLALRSSIHKLKEIADFLLNKFAVDLAPPKRNSKLSLSTWIAKVLLSAREVAETSEAIADQVADSSSPEVEVLEPEEKPIYKISIHPDRNITQQGWKFTEERVSALPPYLLDGQGNLFEKSSYTTPSCDATYTQVVSQHLSNIAKEHIAKEHGQLIELATDNLVVYRVNVHGSPPPYVVHKRSVYKRMTWGVNLGSVTKYVQVVSEHLSNIVVPSR